MSTGSSVTTIRAGEEQTAARPRALMLIDPVLLLAGLGLIACSLVTLKGATRTTDPGHPLFYVERQAVYAAIGLAVALALASTDYTRLRKFKWPFYGMLIVLNIVVYGAPLVRGAHRWIPLPFFQFQSSEFGKILLVVSLAAFAVDRSRRLHERRTTARIMLLALVPALIVIPQPDLGTGMVYVAVGFAILFFAGTSWKQLTSLVALFAISITFVLIAEMLNTGIEAAIDIATTSFDPMAKLAKDIAAGAVLIATGNALIVGYLVFAGKVADRSSDILDRLRQAPAELTLVALVLTIILVIATKAYTGRGTPLRGGIPSGHAARARHGRERAHAEGHHETENPPPEQPAPAPRRRVKVRAPATLDRSDF